MRALLLTLRAKVGDCTRARADEMAALPSAPHLVSRRARAHALANAPISANQPAPIVCPELILVELDAVVLCDRAHLRDALRPDRDAGDRGRRRFSAEQLAGTQSRTCWW